MQPTVASVLASEALRAGAPEVLAGAESVDRPVRWVHVGEVGDIAGLLQGGELLLTTGLAMQGPAREAVRYVAGLAEAGAAALVVELGPAVPRVPDAVVRRARRDGFPLVALHRRVRFVDVTEQVHRGIVAEQLAEVEFAREVHETFTRLALDSAAAGTVVEATADLAGTAVVLEDLSRRVVAFAAHGHSERALLAGWERRSREAPRLETTGTTGPDGWVTAPVGVRGERWGRLVVPDPDDPAGRLPMLLERAAAALELGRRVARDRLGLELQAQGGLLAELAAGRVPDEPTALARARALGLAAAPSYLPLVVAPRLPAPADPLGRHDRTRSLVEQVSTAVRAVGAGALVGALPGGEVGVVLAVRRPRAPADPAGDAGPVAERLVDRLADRLTTDAGDVAIGVGPAAGGVLDAGAGLRQARHVAEVAASLPADPQRRWHRAADVRLRGLLALLQDDPRVQDFVEAELGPLLDLEAGGRGELLDLLRGLVAAGGNKTRLAAATHRSRPALYKQLARLERTLGADLDDPASLLSLGVAVLAHDTARRP